MQRSLPDIFEAIRPIRAEGEDEVRQIWIRAKRDIIETREEFEDEWHSLYPDPEKWYHIATIFQWPLPVTNIGANSCIITYIVVLQRQWSIAKKSIGINLPILKDY